jgi:hypothetical protein
MSKWSCSVKPKENDARTVAYFKVLSRHSSRMTEEHTHKTSIRTVGVPSEIQTGHFPDASRSDAEDAVRPEMACGGGTGFGYWHCCVDATEPKAPSCASQWKDALNRNEEGKTLLNIMTYISNDALECACAQPKQFSRSYSLMKHSTSSYPPLVVWDTAIWHTELHDEESL